MKKKIYEAPTLELHRMVLEQVIASTSTDNNADLDIVGGGGYPARAKERFVDDLDEWDGDLW
ncbi:MAG: hypothetical protein IJP82_10335 [Bacteroidaceae bacterium]|nr:hypothetical protein [Bacteroidaceae bacterium]